MPPAATAPAPVAPAAFAFVGERLWLDFVNTDAERLRPRGDALLSFDGLLRWLSAAGTLDGERAMGMRRRASEQPAGATAALVEARRLRATLRQLAERGGRAEQVRNETLLELNRVLGRSAGTRRLELRRDGTVGRTFVPVGDAFSTLLIPVVESAADALVLGELCRVRRCAAGDCVRVFLDGTRNGRRRWCDMASCGNRAKAARFRARRGTLDARPATPAPTAKESGSPA
jgi:predicted RNA-binding Zn ribbon-like protein